MLKSIFFAPYLTLYVSPLCVILAVQFGAGLFVSSDLVLAVRLSVARGCTTIRLLSVMLRPEFWLGQRLIFGRGVKGLDQPFQIGSKLTS
jgi:hypothetical protein